MQNINLVNPRCNGSHTNLIDFLYENGLKVFDGTYKKNEAIAFIGEGGIGDEIIFARFGKKLKHFGIKTAYISLNNLKHIIQSSNYFDEYYNLEKNITSGIIKYNTSYNQKLIKNFKYFVTPWSAYMNIDKDFIFDFEKDCLWKNSYLKTQKEFDTKWDKIITTKKIKVGIKFSGTPSLENEYKRRLPFDKIHEIFDNKKYQLYSFQKEECIEMIKEYGDVVDLSANLIDWNDTLSALNQMDFIISSCSSIAHASATLNKKTYILIPNNKYTYKIWHDCNSVNEKSLWYSKRVKILKQKIENDWSYPIERLKVLLNLTISNKQLNYEYS
jgi:hypothetical protein